jgi:hypothetical protein
MITMRECLDEKIKTTTDTNRACGQLRAGAQHTALPFALVLLWFTAALT